MESPYGNRIIGVSYRHLPHRVSEFGRYAVTIRCANTLPKETVQRLAAIHAAQEQVESQSEEMRILQRKRFLTLEKYDDAGHGFTPFKEARAAEWIHGFLGEYHKHGLGFSDWVIMPNHLHLLTEGVAFNSVDDFMRAWRGLKGESGKAMNRMLSRRGPFWQGEWYDRLIRDAEEYRKWRNYLETNPVKAGICASGKAYPYLRLDDA